MMVINLWPGEESLAQRNLHNLHNRRFDGTFAPDQFRHPLATAAFW